MAKRQAAPAPWQELERQAYDAYREWPLWLMLRERELGNRLQLHKATKPHDIPDARMGEKPTKRTDS